MGKCSVISKVDNSSQYTLIFSIICSNLGYKIYDKYFPVLSRSNIIIIRFK